MLPPPMSPGVLAFRMVLYTLVSGLQAVILGTMTCRRQYREFPAFYAYTAFSVGRAVVLYWLLYLSNTGLAADWAYFYGYWLTEAGDALLAFAVVYAVFRNVFTGHARIEQIGKVAFSAALVVVLAAAVLMIEVSPGSESVRLTSGVLLLARSVALGRCALLLLLFLTSSYLGLSWHARAVGIALGLGIGSATDLLSLAAWLYVGSGASTLSLWANVLGYMVAIAVWAMYFLPAGTDTRHLPCIPDKAVQEWNAALTELLHR